MQKHWQILIKLDILNLITQFLWFSCRHFYDYMLSRNEEFHPAKLVILQRHCSNLYMLHKQNTFVIHSAYKSIKKCLLKGLLCLLWCVYFWQVIFCWAVVTNRLYITKSKSISQNLELQILFSAILTRILNRVFILSIK